VPLRQARTSVTHSPFHKIYLSSLRVFGGARRRRRAAGPAGAGGGAGLGSASSSPYSGLGGADSAYSGALEAEDQRIVDRCGRARPRARAGRRAPVSGTPHWDTSRALQPASPAA